MYIPIQRYVHIPIIYPFIRFTLPETSSKFAPETLGVGSDEFPFGFWPEYQLCFALVVSFKFVSGFFRVL